MTRRIVEHAGRRYLYSPDNAIPLAERTWALVSGQVMDEITGQPPRSRVTITSERPGFISRVAGSGVVGLVGIPARVFPNLNTQNYTVHLTVSAQGYIPRREEVTIGPVV